MVIGDKIPWAPVLRLHAPILAVVVLVSAAVAGAHGYLGFNLALAPLPFSIVGVALSIFLAFRNNAAYDRLPLSAMCRTIEVDLRRQLGETTVPPLLTPENLRNGTGILR